MKNELNNGRKERKQPVRPQQLRRYLMGIAAMIFCVIITPEILGLRAYVVVSGSMEPEIPTGSLAFVDTEFRDLSEGTVIAYRMGGTVVTHRVSEVLTDGYRTRGDANEQPDGQLVSPDQVIGTVHLVIPCLGYLIVWIQSEKGRILTGILLAVYLICLYFRTGKNNQKENIRKCKKGRRAESILRKKSNENEKINCKNNGTV